MRVSAQPRDAEVLVKDFLAAELADQDGTVGIGVPASWTPTDPPHLEVANDGSPLEAWPVVTYTTIRLTARAASRSEAKARCGLALGLLLAHNGDGVIVGTRYLTGPLPARDPETHAEIASATARVTLRTEPIETGS